MTNNCDLPPWPASDAILIWPFVCWLYHQGIPVRIADMIKSRSAAMSEERKAWIESGHSLPLKIQSASFQRIVDKHSKSVPPPARQTDTPGAGLGGGRAAGACLGPLATA